MSIETNDIPGLRGEHNTAGCYRVYLIDVNDVDTVPDEVQGNVPGDVVPQDGKAFTSIKPTTFEMLFGEDSTYENGAPRVDALLEWPIPKDRLSLMPILHGFHRMRVVAVLETLNPDPDDASELTRLIMGNKEEPAMAFLVKRKTGGDPRTDRSDYTLQVRWTRSSPTPFYNGTPPNLLPITECPTVEQQIADMTGGELYAISSTEQRDEFAAASGSVILADILGGDLWAMLTPPQQAALLAAAGVVSFSGIRDTGPPYTDSLIDT